MDRLIIEGGHPLSGEVTIAGAKNAALGLIPAVILAEGKMQVRKSAEHKGWTQVP